MSTTKEVLTTAKLLIIELMKGYSYRQLTHKPKKVLDEIEKEINK